MKKGFRKLALLGCMATASVLTLFSTTYAFVTLNKTVNVSEFEFDIENQEGLLISLDGINYFQDLNYTQITTKIAENAGVNSFDEIEFTPVTLVGDTDDSVVFEEYSYEYGYDKVVTSDWKTSFVKDSLVLDPTADPDYGTTDANDLYYRHEMVAAEARDYIFVNLWFKIATNGEETSKYQLKFTDRTSITGTDNKVELKNDMTTTGTQDSDSLVTLGRYTDTRVDGEYHAEDIITINPANAMRIGVSVPNNTNKPDLYVYEPAANIGFGSAAVEAEPNNDPLKDPLKNAMYTYYNSTHPLSEYQAGADYHKGFDTYDDVEENVFGTFEYNTTDKTYNTIKISVMIWLEGWDADYIMGETSNEVKIKLGFEAVEVQ